MSTLLAKNAEVLVTMDSQRRELKNAGLYVEEGFIKHVGPNDELPATADTVIDLSGQNLLPGFVNTHHHLNQTLTRILFAAQNNNLFPWLQAQYCIWARTTKEASRASTLIGLGELALSGCTTVFDHTYLFKSGNKVDCQIQAAKDLGVRFHASRGSMSLGQSQGGLPPDDCVEDEAFILRDSERVSKAYHDASPGSMTQIALAPCSPFFGPAVARLRVGCRALNGGSQLGSCRALRVAKLRVDCRVATEARSGTTFHRSETRPSRIARNIGTNGAKIIRGSSLTSGLTGVKIGTASTIFGIIGTHQTLLTTRNGTTKKTA